MRNRIVIGLFIAAAAMLFAFTPTATLVENPGDDSFKWYTWEEAIAANKKEPRKLLVDAYTDWCGWCKKMDAGTFSDAEVKAYLSEKFYAVKLNAEQKEDIVYNGHTFKYVDQGRRGYHELAYTLMNGRMSYPTIVYLNEEQERILISPGYKDVPGMKKELAFVADEVYKTKTFKEYTGN